MYDVDCVEKLQDAPITSQIILQFVDKRYRIENDYAHATKV